MPKLIEFACARSGDKGEHVNVGVLARSKEAYEKLRSVLTKDKVGTFFTCKAERYELPNLLALNFILYNVLKGGGSLNLHIDAQGKAFGQLLLEMDLP